MRIPFVNVVSCESFELTTGKYSDNGYKVAKLEPNSFRGETESDPLPTSQVLPLLNI